jgi:hypothetical protein
MADHSAEASPQVYARIGGVLYLIIIVIGLFGETFVRERLFVPHDPAATASNIRASQFLWRLSIAGELFMLVCAVGLTLIFYLLLKPVSRNLVLLAVFFNLISIALDVANKSHLLEALFLLDDSIYSKAAQPQELDALAHAAVRLHAYGFGTSLIFFAGLCIVLGYLIFRSGYFPKAIGILMQLAGASYLINSFSLLLSPAFASLLFPAILVPAFIGEASFCVWLLAKGVNLQKWNERTSAGAIR